MTQIQTYSNNWVIDITNKRMIYLNDFLCVNYVCQNMYLSNTYFNNILIYSALRNNKFA